MSQSLAKVILHLVFSTKNRQAWLRDPQVRDELYAYQATVLKAVDSPAILINGTEDHVHILCLLSRSHAIKDVVMQTKKQSSKWIKGKGAAYRGFAWQGGYGVFSVSQSNVATVKRYVANQERHHQRMTFQDEFRELCKRHGLEIDERYVWD